MGGAWASNSVGERSAEDRLGQQALALEAAAARSGHFLGKKFAEHGERAAVQTSLVLLDEPDASLHPSAREQMAVGLAGWAEATGAAVIVAGHAPELLSAPDVSLWHVRRDSTADKGRAHVVPLCGQC
jgi:predicted ATPase